MARTHEALLKAEKEARKNYLEPTLQQEKTLGPATGPATRTPQDRAGDLSPGCRPGRPPPAVR